MQIMQSRRHFMASMSMAAAGGVLGARGSLADEGPPETTTVRLANIGGICLAPQYAAEELLRAEGFSEIRYVERCQASRMQRRLRAARLISA
jgi:NitT/TauT family transport system substrate-binding protein